MLLVKYLKFNHIPLRVMGKEKIQPRSEKMVYWVVRRPRMTVPDFRDPGKGFASSEAKDGCAVHQMLLSWVGLVPKT